MTIDPNQLQFGQRVKTPKQFVSAGAFGERAATEDLPVNKRPAQAPEQVSGPYFTTKTGLEIINPGESAASTQQRTIDQEKEDADIAEKNKRDKNATDTQPNSTGGSEPAAPNTGGVQPAASKVSAFDKLRDRLTARGLGALYDAVKNLIQEDLPDDEFTLQLRQTPAYQARFAANKKRVAAGLRPLSEGAYMELEDSYQELMRQYGLPQSYWAKDAIGVQKGFEDLIAGDVAAPELEDRLQLAVDRVTNAPASVVEAMRQYYPDITQGDIIAYTLDPKNTINRLRRQVQAAEIGGAAAQAGLRVGGITRAEELATLGKTRAEELAAAGVTGTTAKQGFQTIASFLPTATKLANIYGQDGYTQAEAEQEVFGLAGMTTAMEKRRRLASQERVQFQQQVGAAGSALQKGRAGAF